jgi:16S rRNA (adenine1518-N6/adenine1519-N6)-dimethyltransferase
MTQYVRPKKNLGQHFLTDANIAKKVADLVFPDFKGKVLEIGPGTGMLTQFLYKQWPNNLTLVEIDTESAAFLMEAYPEISNSKRLICGDFLKLAPHILQNDMWFVVGNFPYNISSQILFAMIQNRAQVVGFGGMFQREVALRIVSKEGNKVYGILSVLTQAYFDVTYEFTVSEQVFNPPPKVKTGVLLAKRKEEEPDCNQSILFDVVKTAFNQRRKTLHNSLKKFNLSLQQWEQLGFGKLRAENLRVSDFIHLAQLIAAHQHEQ